MSRSVLPIKIRPHLIPFFYKEFEGITTNYLNKNVKAAKITMDSNLGFLIRLAIDKAELPEKTTDVSIYISVSNYEGKNMYTAKMYKHVSGEYSFLKVPKVVEKRVNDILENELRIGLLYYMEGAQDFNKVNTDDALYQFMIKYELEDYGYNIEQMRRYYNRAKKKHKNAKNQVKLSSRILNTYNNFAMS